MEGLFIDVSEMVEILGIHEKTVYKIAKTIPGYIKIGGVIRFNRKTFFEETKGYIPKPVENRTRDTNRHGL